MSEISNRFVLTQADVISLLQLLSLEQMQFACSKLICDVIDYNNSIEHAFIPITLMFENSFSYYFFSVQSQF